jgi:phosphonate transport system substrate-binding protein
VLVKTNLDGSYTYHSIGFARGFGHHLARRHAGQGLRLRRPELDLGLPDPARRTAAAGYSMTPGEYFSDVVFSGGHEQTIVGVANGDFDAGVTWADGLGEWEDGYNSGALRRAVRLGPRRHERPRRDLEVEADPGRPDRAAPGAARRREGEMTELTANCTRSTPNAPTASPRARPPGFTPIGHEAYETIIAVRRQQIGG